jgi:hypothetical protein
MTTYVLPIIRGPQYTKKGEGLTGMRNAARIYTHLAATKALDTEGAFGSAKDSPPNFNEPAQARYFGEKPWKKFINRVEEGRGILKALIFVKEFGVNPLTCSDDDVEKVFQDYMDLMQREMAKKKDKKDINDKKYNGPKGKKWCMSTLKKHVSVFRMMFRAIGRKHAIADNEDLEDDGKILVRTGNPMTTALEEQFVDENTPRHSTTFQINIPQSINSHQKPIKKYSMPMSVGVAHLIAMNYLHRALIYYKKLNE